MYKNVTRNLHTEHWELYYTSHTYKSQTKQLNKPDMMKRSRFLSLARLSLSSLPRASRSVSFSSIELTRASSPLIMAPWMQDGSLKKEIKPYQTPTLKQSKVSEREVNGNAVNDNSHPFKCLLLETTTSVLINIKGKLILPLPHWLTSTFTW